MQPVACTDLGLSLAGSQIAAIRWPSGNGRRSWHRGCAGEGWHQGQVPCQGCRVPNPSGASREKELKGARLFRGELESQGMVSYLPQEQCEQHLPQEKHLWLSGTPLKPLSTPFPRWAMPKTPARARLVAHSGSSRLCFVSAFSSNRKIA